MKQFAERGLAKAGIKLIATGDVTDDDLLNEMGDARSAWSTRTTIRPRTTAREQGLRRGLQEGQQLPAPNFMAVGGYDGMQLIYKALEKTKGTTDGEALIDAMKGMSWTSPRGPMTIDPETRDIIQNIYIREVEKVGGELYNVEFETYREGEGPGEGRQVALTPLRSMPAPADLKVRGPPGPRTRHRGPPMLTILFDGIAYGMLLFILACGLSVTLGLMNFVNLAHGAFAMAGGYVTSVLMNRLGVSFFACLPLAFLFAALIGVVLERTLYRHLYDRSHLDQVLFTIGLVFMAISAVDYSLGSGQQFITLPDVLRGRFRSAGGGIGVYRLFIIVICGAPDAALQVALVAHALRQPPARRGRRPARGARPRHQRQPGLRRDLRDRLGPRGSRRRARRGIAGPRPDFPAEVHDLLPDRRDGGRHLQHHRAVPGFAPARRRRRRRQILRPQARRLHHLRHHGAGADLAAAGPLRPERAR